MHKNAVISTFALNSAELSLPLDEWERLDGLIPILKSFYEVTKKISAEKTKRQCTVVFITDKKVR